MRHRRASIGHEALAVGVSNGAEKRFLFPEFDPLHRELRDWLDRIGAVRILVALTPSDGTSIFCF